MFNFLSRIHVGFPVCVCVFCVKLCVCVCVCGVLWLLLLLLSTSSPFPFSFLLSPFLICSASSFSFVCCETFICSLTFRQDQQACFVPVFILSQLLPFRILYFSLLSFSSSLLLPTLHLPRSFGHWHAAKQLVQHSKSLVPSQLRFLYVERVRRKTYRITSKILNF